ncbi:hypothetical protein RRG08_025083 [Elysia crispata]|uniref:Uncharacterized protein n=1 Tax=Elysia crispata TaxID=231223 RepID=A0AAE1DZ44_9GAST|nr:hypothetical protein RRG08_025083 [Elysia crispata]
MFKCSSGNSYWSIVSSWRGIDVAIYSYSPHHTHGVTAAGFAFTTVSVFKNGLGTFHSDSGLRFSSGWLDNKPALAWELLASEGEWTRLSQP